MKLLLSTLDIVFYLLIRGAIIIIVSAYLCSCYEYRRLPNTKRVTKHQVRKAMKYSSSTYAMPKNIQK